MKRCWAGAALLLALLLTSWGAGSLMHRRHSFCAERMELAAEAALENNWEEALRFASQAESQWETDRNPAAVLADHAPLDQIDSLLRQLQPAAAARNGPNYAGLCLQLSQLWKALAREQKPGLTDIF